MTTPAAARTLEGRRLGDFVLREKIGEGGFAAVHRAFQDTLEREAVVKVLHTRLSGRSDVTQRFLREARLATRLDHPYAAHVYAFGAETDGTLWIAMELVRGTPMDKLLEHGPISLDRFVPLFERICEVVQTAHERGIIHRDLKPANVMVLARAGRLLPKLLDFGIARVVDDAQATLGDPAAGNRSDPRTTQVGALMGSPLYMAPEQWADAGSVGPATDIYALGVLAYEALTGRPPFAGTTIKEVMIAHAETPPPAMPPEIPAALNAVLARALAKEPKDRYATAGDFAAAVHAASGHGDAQALPELDEVVRRAIELGAPQPLAEAVAALESARNIDQACALLWDVVAVAVRWIGLLALASRSKIGPGSDDDSREARERLRDLGRTDVADADWLVLARVLTRPFGHKRDAYPVPELIALVHGEAVLPEGASLDGGSRPRFVEAFERLRALRGQLDRRSGKTDEQRRELYGDALAAVTDLLQPLGPLLEYTLVITRKGRTERWRGLRRTPRPALVRRARPLPDGEAYLLDTDGGPVLKLAPLVQAMPPSPGKDEELFFFDGRDTRGARLVAVPHGFEQHDESLDPWFREHLLDLSEEESGPVAGDVAPYRGLATFTTADSGFFFGREKEIDAFVNRLRVEPFLAVVGPSGAGKSSFVQAGVVPRLPTGWRAIVTRPGGSPAASLTARLQRSAVDAVGIDADPCALGDRLRATAAREGSTIVLVVDQLEELFTLCRSDRERSAYASALSGAATSEDDAVRVIITLRDDFLIRAESEPALRERLGRGIKLLTTPAAEDLERILVEPAKRAGYHFEDRALVTTMANEVSGQPGALALLSFTAAELWKLRDRHFQQLTRKSYKAIGGVGGALARHAEAMLAEFSPDEQRLMREAFRQLVTADGTRQVLQLGELQQILAGGSKQGKRAATDSDVMRAQAVIDRLIAARLVVVGEEAGGGHTIEVIHEALLSAWPRLVEWRREDAEGARLRDQLRGAARQWESRGRPRGLLWRDEALAEYQIWRARYAGALSDSEQAFATASIADANRGRRIRRSALVLVFTVLAIGLTVMVELRQRAEEQRRIAHQRVMQSYEERGQQALRSGETNAALVYLTESMAMGNDRPALRFMVQRALDPLLPELAALRGHAGQVWDAKFSPDGKLIATSGVDGTARLWDPELGSELGRLAGHAAGRMSIAWSPDGRVLATGDLAGVVRIWDAASRRMVASYHLGPRPVLAFSHDGALLGSVACNTGRVVIWSMARAAPATEWKGDAVGADDLVFSPDGTRVLIASRSSVPSLWNVDGRLAARFQGHEAQVFYARFDPTGERVITTGSDDLTARIWNAADGKLLAKLDRHDGRVTFATFDPTGELAVTTSADRAVRVWDASTGKLLRVLEGHHGQVNRAFFADRRLVTIGADGTARLWDPREGLELAVFVHPGFLFNGDVNRTGERLVTGSWAGDAKVLQLTPKREFIASDVVMRSHLAGPWLVLPREHDVVRRDITLQQPSTWNVAARSVAVAPTGQLVAGTDSGEILIQSGTSVRSLGTDSVPIDVVAIDPTASRVVSLAKDTVTMRDVDTSRILARAAHSVPSDVEQPSVSFLGPNVLVMPTGWLFSPDLKPIVGLADGAAGVVTISAAPTTRLVAVAPADTSNVHVWTFDGSRLATLPHDGDIRALSWYPDGTRLVTGSSDGTVAVWRVDGTPERIAHVRAHDLYLNAVAVSTSGAFLVTLGADQIANVIDTRKMTTLFSMHVPHNGLEGGASAWFDDRSGELLLLSSRRVEAWKLASYSGSIDTLRRLIECRVPLALRQDRLVAVAPKGC